MSAVQGKRVLLLVPPVTYRATDFVQAAQRLQLDVVIGSSGVPPMGSRPVVPIDPGDAAGSIRRLLATAGKVDAVVAVDAAMLPLAAQLASELGLAHNSVDAIEAAASKAIQRQRWAREGVAQPAFRAITAEADRQACLEAARKLGFPCIVKPVSLSGSRGVLRVDNEARLMPAIDRIRTILAEADAEQHEPILLEEYVPGWEISIDGLLTGGSLQVTAVFDKPDTPEGPTFEETLLVTPSRLPAPTLAMAIALAERAAQALGLRYGPIHAELRIDERSGQPRPVMVELAARSIGGLCSRALSFLDGMSLEMMILQNALGRPVGGSPPSGASGVLMLPVERGGVLQSVDGREDALAVPGITGLSITIPIGENVRPLPWGDRYLGFLFAEGSMAGEVETSLRTAHARLRTVIV